MGCNYTGSACLDCVLIKVVPIHHSPNEGVFELICVVDRKLEPAAVSDSTSLNDVVELKSLLFCRSYSSAVCTNGGQVFVWGNGRNGVISYFMH